MEDSIQQKELEMTKQEYMDFIAGVRKYLEDKGLRHKDVAIKAGRSAVNFSKVLNHRNGCSPKFRRDICNAMNVTEFEMIRLGESARVQPQAEIVTVPTVAPSTDTLQTDEAIKILSTVSHSFARIDSRLKYWMQAFDALPVPVVIVRDGLVYSQNKRSRALWSGIGRPLCDGCRDETCKQVGCEIKESIDKGREIERYKKIGEDYYRVQTSHFTANSHHYAAIVITQINECLTATEHLDSMRAERMFISSSPYETPEYYARADRMVSYVNSAFLNLFEIEREDIQTADDFHIIMSKKLFFFRNVSKAADEVRELKKPANITAKMTNNKTIHFIFRPHLKSDGELAGVMVTVLTPELYSLHHEGEIL